MMRAVEETAKSMGRPGYVSFGTKIAPGPRGNTA